MGSLVGACDVNPKPINACCWYFYYVNAILNDNHRDISWNMVYQMMDAGGEFDQMAQINAYFNANMPPLTSGEFSTSATQNVDTDIIPRSGGLLLPPINLGDQRFSRY